MIGQDDILFVLIGRNRIMFHGTDADVGIRHLRSRNQAGVITEEYVAPAVQVIVDR